MIKTFPDVRPGETVGPVDVCIVGSGAGGGIMACYLAAAGFSVVVLEQGGYFPPAELGRKEVTLLTRIQSMTIFTPTSGDHTRVSLIAGQCYGGGTLAAEGASFVFPDVIKDEWERRGLKSFGRANQKLYEWQDELNRLNSVTEVPMEHHNPNNQILIVGAQREGLKWKHAHRPVKGCMRCGNCTQGCHYGAKQDTARTFLKWARHRGAVAYCGARAEKIRVNFPGADDHPYREKLQAASEAARAETLRELEARSKNAPAKFTVEVSVTDRKRVAARDQEPEGKSLIVHARHLVLSAGPLGDTRLLLKSGINPDGVVGKHFTTHPSSFTMGRFPESVMIRGWDGVACSSEVHHYSNLMRDESYYDPDRHGFILESANSLPWGFANLLPGAGPEHLEIMRSYNHFAGCEVIMRSDAYGRITPDDVIYDISDADNERLLFSTWLMSRLLFRAGARRVYPGLPGLVLDSPRDLDLIYQFKRGKKSGFRLKQSNLYSGHIFGGAVLGRDPRESFADETGECHRLKGLWVADGAAFPTNTGVNCLMSIQLAARKIAQDFIDGNTPTGEQGG